MKRFFAAALLAVSLPSAASAVTMDVAGTAQPWNWTDGGQNASLAYGYSSSDGSGPAVVTFASAGITAGGTYSLLWLGGLTSAFGGSSPEVDNGGYLGSRYKDDELGSSGNYFPSHYVTDGKSADPNEGIFLNALIYAFTDSDGNVIGDPQSLGTYYNMGSSRLIGVTATAPLGATQIQFGLNDDIFGDNSGSLQVCVAAGGGCDAVAAVPEPDSWALMIFGFGAAGAALRGRRRTPAVAA